jgi:hypothetical protein
MKRPAPTQASKILNQLHQFNFKLPHFDILSVRICTLARAFHNAFDLGDCPFCDVQKLSTGSLSQLLKALQTICT